MPRTNVRNVKECERFAGLRENLTCRTFSYESFLAGHEHASSGLSRCWKNLTQEKNDCPFVHLAERFGEFVGVICFRKAFNVENRLLTN